MARKKKAAADDGEVSALPEENAEIAAEKPAVPATANVAAPVLNEEGDTGEEEHASSAEAVVEEREDEAETAGDASGAPLSEEEESLPADEPAGTPESGEVSPEVTEDASDADAEPDDGDDEAEDEEDEAAEPTLPLAAVVEAVLFAAREPLKPAQIARAVGKRTRQETVKDVIGELNVHYLETGRAFEIAEISGRYQLMSRPEFASHIMKIYPKRELSGEKEKTQRLTPAALDTLAIIAYKQPVTRAEIEHIRGVGCGPVLKALLERDSIRIAGKRLDMLGQPLVYGTTESFLAEFGLGSLDELPMRNDFLAILGEDIPPVEVLETDTAETEGDGNTENAQPSAAEGEDVPEENADTGAVPAGEEEDSADDGPDAEEENREEDDSSDDDDDDENDDGEEPEDGEEDVFDEEEE